MQLACCVAPLFGLRTYGVIGQTSHKDMDFFLFWPGYSQKNAFLKKTKKKKTKKEFMLHCVFHEFIVIVAIPEMTPETSR